MKSLKFSNVLLCEYVAEGALGKHTLVNVFTGDIRVAKLPARIQIAAYIEMQAIPGLPRTVDFELYAGAKRLAVVTGSFPELVLDQPMLLVLPAMDLKLDNDVIFKIVGVAEGFRSTLAVERRIYQANADPASASERLSEQSPPAAQETSSPPAPSRRGSRAKRRRS